MGTIEREIQAPINEVWRWLVDAERYPTWLIGAQDVRAPVTWPAPGARFVLAGDSVKVWAAETGTGAGVPGTVLNVTREAIEVACGDGSVRLLTVQPPGGKRMPAGAFAAGRRIGAGTRLA